MITKEKVTEIFCIIDEFDKNLDVEMRKKLSSLREMGDDKRHWNRKGRQSRSEMMNILVRYHFGTYRNFKEYYPDCVLGWMSRGFPDAVSYNRFAEFMPRVFIDMLLFMRPYAFGKCTGITFVDSAMIPVCHNVRRYFNKVFASLAKNGKGTMGWCHGFKLHLMCNDRGDIITFCLTGTNVDDRDTRVWEVFTMELYGRCSPTGDTHQERTLRGPFRLRHPPRAWTEGQHEEQDHAHVGQDHAPQEMLRIT